VFIVNLIKTWRGPANAPADPWGGATLEWAIPSPPQEWNFTVEPTVTGKDDLWTQKRAAGVRFLPEPALSDGKGIHLPGPSWWPLVVAVGILVFFLGFIIPKFSWGFPFHPVGIFGFLLTTVGIFKWAYEPPDANATHH